nr:hypothetical protein [Tanacetum cinerariifolium]
SRFREYRLKRVSAIPVFGTAGLVVRTTRVFSWKVLIIAVLRQGKDECFAGTAKISCWRSYLQPQLWHTITSFERRLTSHGSCVWVIGFYRRSPRRRLQRLVGDLAATDSVISDEDHTLLLLTSLPSSYDNFMDTLLYGRDTLKLEDGRSSRLGCYICQPEENLKRDCPRYNHKKSQGCVRIEDHVSGLELMESFTVKMQSGKIKVIKGSLVVVSGTRRVNYVYTLDGQVVTRKTLKGRKQLGEYQTGWKIKTSHVLDSCNQRSTQQCTKSGIAKHLGVAGIKQHNGLVKETNVTLVAKVRCFLIQSVLSKVFWAEDTTMSIYLVNRSPSSAIGFKTLVDMGNKLSRLDDVTSKVVLYRNMGSNENREYKKIFIGFGVGDMDARSDVYVLSNGCEKFSDNNDGYYWEYTPGIRVAIPWGVTVHVLQQEVGLLEGHSILSLKDSLSGDCDVKKNAAYMTLTEAAKEAIWLKGLTIESGFELKIVAGIATGALLKAIPGSRFHHELMLLRIEDF